MNPQGLTDVMYNFGSGLSAMSGFVFVYTVCTFNLLTLMFRHGRVMLQIKNILIARALEITFVFTMATCYKTCFKI